jgi:hypothetical protein
LKESGSQKSARSLILHQTKVASEKVSTKKSRFLTAAVCVILFAILILPSTSFAEALNTTITVLSYSSYVSPTGHYITLGEVQHTGNHALESVTLNIEISDENQTQLLSSTTSLYAKNFLPGQKAPFYMDFGKIDYDTISKTRNYNITLAEAPPTNYDQYPNLEATVSLSGIENEVYSVSGSIVNSGNQTADDVKIYATYYNNAGIVIAVGLSELKEPIAPNSSAEFSLNELDAAPSLTQKISSYALLIQTSTQIPSQPNNISPSSTPEVPELSSIAILVLLISSTIATFSLLRLKLNVKRNLQTPVEN